MGQRAGVRFVARQIDEPRIFSATACAAFATLLPAVGKTD
jgi:hypothetical protein